jgi:hypothetical protein
MIYADILPGSILIEYPPKNNKVSGTDYHADVINHCDHPNLGDGRVTDAHETIHFINNDIRNSHSSDGKINAFYLGENQAAIVPEPPFAKSLIAPFVPPPLQGFRFPTYVTGQREWDDRPLYLFDEWSAYIIDSIVSIQDYQNKINDNPGPGQYDGIGGPVEFSVYAIALGMACEKHAPKFWRYQLPFRRLLTFMLIRSQSVYEAGKSVPIFMSPTPQPVAIEPARFPLSHPTKSYPKPSYQPPVMFTAKNIRTFTADFISPAQLVNNLRTHSAAQEMRDFIIGELGSVWLS